MITFKYNIALKEVKVCYCFLPEKLITTKLFQLVFQKYVDGHAINFHIFLYIHRAALIGYEKRSTSQSQTSQKLP
jgi:hypothetical protein